MLPEILSNMVCSLRPKEEKFTFSSIFKINSKGEIIEEWYGKTVIKSNKRFSYAEAQEIIDKKKRKISKENSLTNKAYEVEKDMVEAILNLNEIAQQRRKEREKKLKIREEKLKAKEEKKELFRIKLLRARERRHATSSTPRENERI